MDFSKLPVFYETDIAVCGGGTAGAFAAKAAADMGKKVLIVEQFGSLGGTSTNGLVHPVMGTYIDGNPQCSYISRIVYDKLLKMNAAEQRTDLYFDPLALKCVLEEMCDESGVNILYYTFIADVITENGKIKALVVANKQGLGLIKAEMFIDATGDADACVRAGAEYSKGNPENGKNQPTSLRYIVSGIDFEKFGEFILENNEKTGKTLGSVYRKGDVLYVACCEEDSWAFGEIFDKALAAGDITPEDRVYWQGFQIPGRIGSIAFNNPEFFEFTDGTNPEHLTKIQIEGKKRIFGQLKFYKKYFKGFEDAYISEIAPMVGVRESRNVVCEYMLKAEDLLGRRKFDDMICQSNYPVDVHGGEGTDEPEFYKNDDGKPWYEIPFRSLVVKGFSNLLVAGRCLGAEFIAQSSLRVQQSARASGEAAGIGAALALENRKTPKEILGEDIRNEMIKKGAKFLI